MDLVQRFATVEDLSDPTLLDDLQMHLEKIQLEDEEFMQILLIKKDEMIITWEQPWYQRTNCLTRPLKTDADDTAETYLTDTICSEEGEKIGKNWKSFRKTYDVPNKPECLARWRNKDKSRHPNTPEEFVRRFVMAYLARGLKRTVYQVYKFFISHYGSPYKGRYSLYEENIMAICVYHNPRNVVPYLSAVLGREPRGIYKKLLQIYNGKPERKKLKWTLPLATKFLNLLIKYSGEPLENLKNKRIDKSVWLQLENDMDQQYIYLQSFWYHTLHIQLFVKCDVKLNKLRKKVLKNALFCACLLYVRVNGRSLCQRSTERIHNASTLLGGFGDRVGNALAMLLVLQASIGYGLAIRLKLYPYRIWSDIRWKEILKHFDDAYSHGFLYKITYGIIKQYKGYRQIPMEELLAYGLQKVKTIPNKRLRTLVLNENQELEVISYKK